MAVSKQSILRIKEQIARQTGLSVNKISESDVALFSRITTVATDRKKNWDALNEGLINRGGQPIFRLGRTSSSMRELGSAKGLRELTGSSYVSDATAQLRREVQINRQMNFGRLARNIIIGKLEEVIDFVNNVADNSFNNKERWSINFDTEIKAERIISAMRQLINELENSNREHTFEESMLADRVEFLAIIMYYDDEQQEDLLRIDHDNFEWFYRLPPVGRFMDYIRGQISFFL
jgi:hypothetical protein